MSTPDLGWCTASCNVLMLFLNDLPPLALFLLRLAFLSCSTP
jgi:hypothetical protein